ncbi:potassium channel family protein [Methanocaldococcus indicus]|uniref:potassium channel family protein n=1 Tax=Methanocaldococcus indicus TaxID=213231 RepID=UPI003C6D9647
MLYLKTIFIFGGYLDVYYKETIKKLIGVLFFSILLILTYAYLISIIEHIDFFDALYFSVITITTTGYGDFTPKTQLGKILTIIYLILGVGIVMYLFSIITEFIVEGKFRELIKMKSMASKLKKMENHYIICGYGKMGKVIGDKFLKENISFIAIDKNEEILKEEFEKQPDKFVYIVGDATKEDILKKAKIDKAKCLLAVLPTDADNVFLTLTAKELNPKIEVVAKANERESIKKLKVAGANKIVSPYLLGGLRMAVVSTRPGILDFLRTFLKVAKEEYNEDIHLEKFVVNKNSPLVNKSIKEANIRRRTGATIVGIKRGDEFFINPSPEFIIKEGDILYVLGTNESIEYFKLLLEGKR